MIVSSFGLGGWGYPRGYLAAGIGYPYCGFYGFPGWGCYGIPGWGCGYPYIV